MRGSWRRSPTARCRRASASGRTSSPKSSACRASRSPMRCICCTGRAWSPRAAAAALKSPGSIPRASASSTRCAAPSTRWPRGSPPGAPRPMPPAARGSRRRCRPDAPSTGRRRWRELIALDVDFHRAIYRLAGNPAIEEMIAPQWPHMRRSMATVLAELDYRESAWAEHEAIAAHDFCRQCESRGGARRWRMRRRRDG